MRYITELCPDTISLLERVFKYSVHHPVRRRAHCILLSFHGTSISKLAALYRVDRDTISHWFNSWENARFVGLYDRPGRGTKLRLKPSHASIIGHWVRAFPKNLNKVLELLRLMLGIRVCQKTLQRFLHRIRFSWRRIRRRVKGRPDPAEYQEKKAQLEAYQQEARAGNIDLYYADQSGFCLTPPVPYAWQEKGAPIEIPTSNSRKLNVMGFLNPLTHTLTAIRLKLISRGRWQAPVLITFAIQFPKKRS